MTIEAVVLLVRMGRDFSASEMDLLHLIYIFEVYRHLKHNLYKKPCVYIEDDVILITVINLKKK